MGVHPHVVTVYSGGLACVFQWSSLCLCTDPVISGVGDMVVLCSALQCH